MKIIDAANPSGPTQLTAMIVGPSRSGKSHFMASWPRPILLCDASEHGWTTIEYMNNDFLYEANRKPYIIAIEDPSDLGNCLVALQKQARGEKVDNIKGWPVPQGAWEIGTVGIDSLTFYADAYFSKLEVENAGKNVDGRQLYGNLGTHLRYMMIQFHKLPYNVLWSALPKEGDANTIGGAMILGSTAEKAPARCDLWVLMQAVDERDAQTKQTVTRFDMHTTNHRNQKAGHRFGSLLPPVMDPEYKLIEECLGMTPWLERLTGGNAKKTSQKAPTTKGAQAAQ